MSKPTILDELSWIWIEKLQTVSGLSAPFVGGLIGLFVFLLNFALGRYAEHFTIVSIETFVEFIAMLAACIVIAYLITSILYLIRILKDLPKLMNMTLEGDEITNELLQEIKHAFANKRAYYGLIILIMMPFVMTDSWFYLVRPDRNQLLLNENQWTLAFEIYGVVEAYFIEYLIAMLIWIIINIQKNINLLGNVKFRSYIKFDIFTIEELGGRRKAMDLIKEIAIRYFTCLTLTILTFSIPLEIAILREDTSFYLASKIMYIIQEIIYIFLLILGLHYIWAIYIEIRNLFDKYILDELRNIDAIYSEKRNELHMKLSRAEADKNKNYEEIKQLSTALEIINSDRESLTQIAKNSYNISTTITIASSFIGSMVIPSLTMIKLFQEILKSG